MTCQSKYVASIFLNDFDTCPSMLLYKKIHPRYEINIVIGSHPSELGPSHLRKGSLSYAACPKHSRGFLLSPSLGRVD